MSDGVNRSRMVSIVSIFSFPFLSSVVFGIGCASGGGININNMMNPSFDGRTRTHPAREVSRCTNVEMSGVLVDIHRVTEFLLLSLSLSSFFLSDVVSLEIAC